MDPFEAQAPEAEASQREPVSGLTGLSVAQRQRLEVLARPRPFADPAVRAKLRELRRRAR